MPEYEFFLAIDLSDEARFDEMLMALGASVLGHLGYPAAGAADTLAAVHAELTRGGAEGLHRCHIQFRAAGGEMQIVVAYAGGPEWRTTRPLPASEKRPPG